MSSIGARTGRHVGPVPVVVATVVAVVVLQWVLVLLFGWPAARSAPHDLPLAIYGPQQTTSALTASVDTKSPGSFTWTTVSSADAARDAVLDRQVYAALVLEPSGVTLYTASAASPAVAASLATAVPAAVTAAQPQAPVTVTDLAPNPPGDPHGAALGVVLIPLMITSLAAGALVGLLAPSRMRRLALLAGYAVAAGLLSTLAVQTMLGALTGSWIANAAVSALACLAVASITAGLAAAFRVGGVAIAAGVVFFFGVPFSGASSAWQLLPPPWGVVGQALPAGALATATRSVAFFSGAGGTVALATLSAWAVVGVALTAVVRGARRPA
ncbi:MAG: hypothetical protein U0R65_01970 [Candidatus Nanopelagicales bacterium]